MQLRLAGFQRASAFGATGASSGTPKGTARAAVFIVFTVPVAGAVVGRPAFVVSTRWYPTVFAPSGTTVTVDRETAGRALRVVRRDRAYSTGIHRRRRATATAMQGL